MKYQIHYGLLGDASHNSVMVAERDFTYDETGRHGPLAEWQKEVHGRHKNDLPKGHVWMLLNETCPSFQRPDGTRGATRPVDPASLPSPFRKPTEGQLAHRFLHHTPTDEQARRYGIVRLSILAAAKECVEVSPCCPEQTRALNALDEAMFLFNAAIARHDKKGAK